MRSYDTLSHGSTLTLFGHPLLQPVDEKGDSERSNVAVYLQEEVTIDYGHGRMQWQPPLVGTKHCDMRRAMFHTGTDSSSGHFTLAVRQQRDGR